MPGDIGLPKKLSQARIIFMSDAIVERNGVGSYYRDLVEHLADYLGHVELVCPGGKNSGDCERIHFPMPGDPTEAVFIPKLGRICKRIRAMRPHIIVVSTPGPYGLIGMAQARLLRAHLLVGFQTEYDKLTKLYWNRILYGISKIYLEAMYRLFFRMGIAVFIPDPSLRPRIRRMGAQHIAVMGTPLAKDFLTTPVSPLAKEIASILYIGRLAKEKNVDEILNSASQLPKLHFVIAGDGPLRQKVVEQSNTLDNLQYLGWVPRHKVLSAIDQSDLLILPSKVEAFGTVALEAMSRRRLVLVASTCGINRDPLLRKGLLQIQSGEPLIGAIHRVKALNEYTRNQVADSARKGAETFTANTVTRWLEFINQFIGE